MPDNKKTHIFLTNQTTVIYKMLTNLASQSQPSKDIHALELNEVCEFMEENFHPKRFIVRKRFKFCSKMDRKSGESIQELVPIIQQDAVTCDFPSITNLLDKEL